MDVDDMTLNAWCKRTYKKPFKEVFADKRQGGKASLRRSQWKLAENNATMAIWLGKQYLGQKDQPDSDNTMDAIAKNIQSLADIVAQSAPNRNIEDLE